MEIVTVAAIGVVATIFVILLRKEHPAIATVLGSAAGVFILLQVAGIVAQVAEVIRGISAQYALEENYWAVVLKAVGIAYIAEFGADVCKDAGEAAIAAHIQLAGKLLIVLMALPILVSLLKLAVSILP